MIKFTRIDSDKLQAACDQASKKLQEIMEILEPYLVLIHSDERASLLRAREGFEPAAESLCRTMREYPDVAKVSGFEPDAVEEDLDNLRIIQPPFEKLEELRQRFADSRLTWSAEAWAPSLAAYRVAKATSEVNPALRKAIKPMAKIFAATRREEQEGEGEDASTPKAEGPAVTTGAPKRAGSEK